MTRAVTAVLRALLAGALTLALLLLVALLLVASTPGGSAWLLASATGFAGDKVRVEGATGTLVDGMSVARLTVTLARVAVVAEQVEVAVFWPDLLRERLTLVRARAASLDIRVQPAPDDEGDDEGKPAGPVILPVALEARDLAVERLAVTVGDAEPVVLGPGTLRGEMVRGVIRLAELSAFLYGIEARGAGQFGTGAPYGLDGQVSWDIPAARVRGQGTVNGSLARLRFRQALALPDPVTVTGTLRLLGEARRLDAEARWQALARPLGADDGADGGAEGADALVLRSRGGQLRLSGWTDGYEARGGGSVGLAGGPFHEQPFVDVLTAVQGDLEGLEIRSLTGTGFGGTVAGTGRLRFRDLLTGEFTVTGRGLDPAGLDPRFPGRVDVDATGRFDGAGNFKVEVTRASGVVAGRALGVGGTVGRAADVYSVDGLRVTAGANRLEAQGRWGRELAATFRVEAPELADLWPGLSGRLAGSGELGGTLARPRLALDLAGEALAFGNFRAAALEAEGGLDRADRLDLRVAARDVRAGERLLGNLVLTAAGPRRDHELGLALAGADVDLALGGSGRWADGRFTASLTSGAVTLPAHQAWRLDDPLVLDLQPESARASAHCWALHGNGDGDGDGNGNGTGGSQGRLCLGELNATPASQSGSLQLRGFPIGVLAELGLVPDGLVLGGVADLDADVRRSAAGLTGSLRWEQRDTTLAYRTEEGDELETRFEDFLLTVDGTEAAVEYRAVVSESFGTLLTAVGRVTDPLGPAPGIDGRITGSIPDLSRLGPLVESLADVGDLKGRVNVDVTLAGRLREPDILGGVELTDGALAVPVAGITVDRIRLSARGQPDGRVALDGYARSGQGHVDLGGFLEWRNRLLPRGEVTVKGRNVEVIRLPEGTVLVSPNVTALLDEGQFRVTGSVLVPRADITLKEIGEGEVVPSLDTVVHGRATTGSAADRPLYVVDGLEVRLGPQVRFAGFGLDTRLTGNLVLGQDDPANPYALTAQGSVQVAEGRFAILGEELTIDRGSLVFGGVLSEPGVDARASRDVSWEGREVTVGVLLSGTLSRIQTRIFSEPAMGEMDALSYLTTGKPLSANASGDRFSVANAALGLGLQGALPVAQKLGSALNVDEIGLAGSGGEGTEVVIGEQLGEDLYLRYSYGIFNKLGTIKATYRIGRRLSIEGSSGEEQALDLLYSISW